MVQGQVFLKGKGRAGTFPISRFIVFTFRNNFFVCKVVLCILRKIVFYYHHNFIKKGHSKLSKNEPEMPHKLKKPIFKGISKIKN